MRSPFIAREYELARLNDLLTKKTASMVVINGRRRVGKSRLIEEFAKNKRFLRFSGLAPEQGITAQDQRNEFALQLGQQTGLPRIQADDWSILFQLLADKIDDGRVIVLFDEITWMAHDEPTFLSKLKNAWDLYYKNNPKLIFVICGSISAWIEKNILSSTAYFGRISLHITLEELRVDKASNLLEALGFKGSRFEKLIYLSIMGGIPWYIEQVKPKNSAVDNIKKLCFESQGLLVNEYKYIFHDLFNKRGDLYAAIVALLAHGPLDYESLATKLGYKKGSALTSYLQELVDCGYISKHPTWDLSSGKLSKLSRYRLSDCFLRFYFRMIAPKLNAIKEGQYNDIALSSLPGWWSILGLQIENLVLNNLDSLHKLLAIDPIDILAQGPYFQRSTKRNKGCQIDYLIETKMCTLYVCEIKFSQNPLSTSVIESVGKKIDALTIPKHYAVHPVLIHCNEVSEQVIERDYFYRIINFADMV